MRSIAAYVAYTDHEIGRVIQAVENMGKLDNTLIIYINGDNGTSAEGGLHRHTLTKSRGSTASACRLRRQMKWYDAWGTDRKHTTTCRRTWSWAFRHAVQSWFKQIASHLGGVTTRHVYLMARPHQGCWRHPTTSSTHVIDIVPTILEVIRHSAQPEAVDGIKQSSPIEGTSFAYTFDAANASVAFPAQDPVLRNDGRSRHLS